ncbi:PsiF family protein [Klebsiella pneumoniae]|nr:PsiF family protein [Klebsiella pneumoniae]
MKITLLMTLLFGLIFISAVGAAEKTPTPQQQRMTDCNQQASAKMLKGEERKTFMSQCLKKRPRPRRKGAHPQQQKMSDCSKAATAKSLKGDERSTFMSSCLKKA